MSADGTRALITTYVDDSATGTSTTRVAVLDTTTGTQTGTTLSLTGHSVFQSLNANGARAVIIATPSVGVHDPATNVIEVAVLDTTHGAQVGTTLSLTGEPTALLSTAKGSRAVIITEVYDPTTRSQKARVTVIDSITGTQTGTTVTVDGAPYSQIVQRLSADGSRAVISTSSYDLSTGASTTRVAVIDTATGAQIGSTLTLAGSQYVTDSYPHGSPLLSVDGKRALIVTTSAGTTGVTAIDTTTGAQIGDTLTLTGELSSLPFSADGTRALLKTIVTDPATGTITTSRVVVIDTATGTQIGTTITLTGVPMGVSTLMSADGTRALIKTIVTDPATGTTATRVAVINTTTGTQIGTTLTLSGYPLWPMLSANGGTALITTTEYDPATRTDITRVMAINTTTGAQTGTTLTLTGVPSGPPVLSADGGRALITTGVSNATTRVAVIRIV